MIAQDFFVLGAALLATALVIKAKGPSRYEVALLFSNWFCWFRPIPGWLPRLKEFNAGRTLWPHPVTGELKIVPWPKEWLVISTKQEDIKTENGKKNGFEFMSSVCSESLKLVPPGMGVRCVRCGVHLHPDHAAMLHDASPPSCSRCRPLIRFWMLF